MSKRSGGGGRDSCDIPFHYFFQSTLSAGANAQFLAPALFPRLSIEADAWAHFRVKKLSFRMHKSSAAADLAAGFAGGVQDAPPATIAAIGELLPSIILPVTQVVPTDWIHVSKAELAGPFPWYKTVAGAADPTEESPGYFCVAGTTTSVFTIEFRGLFQFKTSLATANTPVALEARRRIREERIVKVMTAERDVLLKILATTPTAGGLSYNQKASA